MSEFPLGLSASQWRDLLSLYKHAGAFKNGYGKSAHCLVRKQLAKRKDMHGVWMFCISKNGREVVEKCTIPVAKEASA